MYLQQDMSLPQDQVQAPLHDRLLGRSPAIQEVCDLIGSLARTELTVLITGETGTGKDIAARMLHRHSLRNGKPFIKVTCPAFPESLLESELFGYEPGAFTGARSSKVGLYELAHEGTIFLDEIGAISQPVQSKFLQVLDGEPFMRIGGVTPVTASVRVIAATNVSLDEAQRRGKLRKDICFRLSEVVIHIPPLRERREDIPVLAEHFNYNFSLAQKRRYHPLTRDILRRMAELDWAGNVRELAGRVKEYVTTTDPACLLENSSPVDAGQAVERALIDRSNGRTRASENFERRIVPLKEATRKAVEETERTLIEDTLAHTLWNRRKAAELLQISYSSLLRRIDAYNIGKSNAE